MIARNSKIKDLIILFLAGLLQIRNSKIYGHEQNFEVLDGIAGYIDTEPILISALEEEELFEKELEYILSNQLTFIQCKILSRLLQLHSQYLKINLSEEVRKKLSNLPSKIEKRYLLQLLLNKILNEQIPSPLVISNFLLQQNIEEGYLLPEEKLNIHLTIFPKGSTTLQQTKKEIQKIYLVIKETDRERREDVLRTSSLRLHKTSDIFNVKSGSMLNMGNYMPNNDNKLVLSRTSSLEENNQGTITPPILIKDSDTNSLGYQITLTIRYQPPQKCTLKTNFDLCKSIYLKVDKRKKLFSWIKEHSSDVIIFFPEILQ